MRPPAVTLTWVAICAVLIGFAIALVYFGDRFAWERELQEIPALWLAGGLSAAGLVYVLLIPLIHWTLRAGMAASRAVLALIIIAGFAMRLIMIPAMPALEDDFYRYLWDGALTAHGLNPYALAPDDVRADTAPPAVRQLAEQGTLVLDRVNHGHIKTVYPPVAQAAFALAYWIEPWSLRAWRLVCLAGETVSLALLLALLAAVGRAPVWVSLYWLNPLVVKELMNSAHMEAIVLPFVLGAVALLASRRPVMAAASLGLAIGAKLWPVMLLPLVLRPLLAKPWQLAAALTILGCMAVAWLVPPLFGGLGQDSGFVAYATHWQTNSALFQLLQSGMSAVLGGFDVARETPGMVVRLVCAATAATLAVWLARSRVQDSKAIVHRAALIVLVIFLLSPAQFPWYAAWVLIFTPFLPLSGVLALTVFMPLYYASFHLFGIDAHDRWNVWLVRAEWLAVAALLFWDARRAWRHPFAADLAWSDAARKRT